MASVLITGASKGIGRATAVELARRGHRVIATARDPRALDGLPAERRLALDVTAPDSVAAAVREAGDIDVLVSNAGAIFYAAVEATPPEEFARLLDRNTIGALRVAQAVGGAAGRTDQMMTPEEVAAGIADAAEAATLPLRIPPGRAAAEILAVRRT